MKQRKRRLPADKVREAVLGRTWYERTNTPETFTCTRCNEERNSVGQEDGICLRCRWEMKKEARAATRAGGLRN